MLQAFRQKSVNSIQERKKEYFLCLDRSDSRTPLMSGDEESSRTNECAPLEPGHWNFLSNGPKPDSWACGTSSLFVFLRVTEPQYAQVSRRAKGTHVCWNRVWTELVWVGVSTHVNKQCVVVPMEPEVGREEGDASGHDRFFPRFPTSFPSTSF